VSVGSGFLRISRPFSGYGGYFRVCTQWMNGFGMGCGVWRKERWKWMEGMDGFGAGTGLA